MQKTERYGLNLWELSDRIQMEDFNADNQKLDAALALLAAGGGGVDEIERASGSLYPTFSLASLFWMNEPKPRWDEYSLIILTASVTETTGTPYVLLSNSFYSESETIIKHTFSPGGCLYVLTPFKDGTRNLAGFLIANGNCQVFSGDTAFNNIKSFQAGARTPAGADTESLIRNMGIIGIR